MKKYLLLPILCLFCGNIFSFDVRLLKTFNLENKGFYCCSYFTYINGSIYFFLDTDSNNNTCLFSFDTDTGRTKEIKTVFLQQGEKIIGIYESKNDGECLLELIDTSSVKQYLLYSNKDDSFIKITADIFLQNKFNNVSLPTYDTFSRRYVVDIPNSRFYMFNYTDKETLDEANKAWLEEFLFKIGFSTDMFIRNTNKANFYEYTDKVDKNKIISLKNEKGLPVYFINELDYPVRISKKDTILCQSSFVVDDFSYMALNIFLYKINFEPRLPQNAVLNDSRVRLRSSPDLSGKTLALLNKGDALKVTDRSEEKYTIDGESWYWYKVETDDYPDGWIYGKYLDIEE
ncbi:SH3 domain-containing protein [Treponema socranskii]|uniref:SH3 domain-containing protein n=1 Tax=Treponema socranskii TaxID=53419 RepID=UPI0023EFD190|nr:SH3 domain-containing protein [Treponema socranskii]